MKTRVINDHDEISLLLPWYVNGTLDASQKSLVEDHVHSCIVCRKAFAIEKKTLKMFRNESPLDQSVQAGFERLLSSIDARTSAASRQSLPRDAEFSWQRILDKIRSWSGARLRPALVTAPLAALAIIAVMTFILLQQPPVSGKYHTLARPVAGVANADDIHVIFARGTSSETIERLLNSLQAQIVEGPNAVGVYTVRLMGVVGESKRQAAILGLRNQQHVIFAEAAQPLSVSNHAVPIDTEAQQR